MAGSNRVELARRARSDLHDAKGRLNYPDRPLALLHLAFTPASGTDQSCVDGSLWPKCIERRNDICIRVAFENECRTAPSVLSLRSSTVRAVWLYENAYWIPLNFTERTFFLSPSDTI